MVKAVSNAYAEQELPGGEQGVGWGGGGGEEQGGKDTPN